MTTITTSKGFPMNPLTSFPIPKDIRTSAADFFGCSFDECLVHLSEEPKSLGALAFTDGRDIWMDPQVPHLSQKMQRFIYGHELAHIVQQRLGKVGERQRDGKCDHLQLEAEADNLAWAWIHGGESWLPGVDCQPPFEPQIQCLISISGTPIKSSDALPTSVQLVTQLIQGGSDWLHWAITEGQSQFDFPDALTLVDGIQSGLHGNQLILLRDLKLLINPIALLSLPDVGIEAIEASVNQTTDNVVVDLEIAKTLENEGFIGQDKLSLVPQFLSQLQIQDKPVFQALNLSDQVAIYRAMSDTRKPWMLKPEIQVEAAAYAVAYASSAGEFADYYQYYMSLFNRIDFSGLGKPKRAGFARQRQDIMTSELRDDLRCPILAGIPSPEDLKQQMTAWFSAGYRLGFSQISRAIAQMSKHSAVTKASDSELKDAVKSYLRTAQKIVQSRSTNLPQVAQDGSALFYTFGHSPEKAILKLERGTGCITLQALKADIKESLNEPGVVPLAQQPPI